MAFVTVSGSIGRTFFDGKGAEIIESWKGRDEKTMTKRWSAFFEEPHGLSEGDQVEVSGIHGDKLDEWQKDGELKHSVKRSINKAKLRGDTKQAAPAEPEPWADNAPAEEWPSTESTPF